MVGLADGLEVGLEVGLALELVDGLGDGASGEVLTLKVVVMSWPTVNCG